MFTSWSMKLSLVPLKYVIGWWICTRNGKIHQEKMHTTLAYIKKNKLRGPPKSLFSSLHYPLSWSNMFCNGWGKRGSLVVNVKGPWQRNVVCVCVCVYNICVAESFHSYKERREEEGERLNMMKIPKIALPGHILKKNSTHPFFGARSLLLVHVRFTLSESPKAINSI